LTTASCRRDIRKERCRATALAPSEPGNEDLMKNAASRLSTTVSASLWAILSLSLAGCSSSGTGPSNKELEPLVGKWRASTLLLTNLANPDVSIDLVESGATFTISILSTGEYSATLAAFGQSNNEIGTVEVSGNQVTITPTSPEGPPLVATFGFQGGTLVLDGTSEYDFNQDGTPETAQAHIELNPYDS